MVKDRPRRFTLKRSEVRVTDALRRLHPCYETSEFNIARSHGRES
jgi:hypothetical protein